MLTLEIICLASTLIAVSVTTWEAIHNIEVIRAEFGHAITVLGKVTGVDRTSTWCSSYFELKKTKKQKVKPHPEDKNSFGFPGFLYQPDSFRSILPGNKPTRL